MKNILFLALACLVGLSISSCMTKRQKTIQNIMLGIKTETTASAKYEAYAQKAMVEGYDTIANLFRAASKSEAIHTYNHSVVLKSFKAEMENFKPTFNVKSTADNLQESINGESKEVTNIYPMFIEDATSKRIGKPIVRTLNWALSAEKKHLVMFRKALDALRSNDESKLPYIYHVCPVCGDTYDVEKLPEYCEFCHASSMLFLEIK